MQSLKKIEGGFLDIDYEDNYLKEEEEEFDEDGAIEVEDDFFSESYKVFIICGGTLIIGIIITCLFCYFLRSRKRKEEKANRHEFGGYFPRDPPRKAKNNSQ